LSPCSSPWRWRKLLVNYSDNNAGLYSSVLTGTHIDPRQGERPFAEVVEARKESWHRIERSTAARYESILSLYLLPEFGRTAIVGITHEVVQRYVNRLAADPNVSPSLARSIYATLRAAISYGVRMNLVKVNPCSKIDLPRPRRSEMLFLTASEVRALAEAIDPYYRTLVYFAAYTGLRAGEIGALRRKDVDLLRGVVHVRRALKDVGGKLEFGPTKNRAERTVLLPRSLREMLAEHLSGSLPGGSGPESLVFPSRTGKPLRHNAFRQRPFKPAIVGDLDNKDPKKRRAPALPSEKHGLRFHDLRHTAASLSVAAGANIKQVSTRLGHSSVVITLDRYTHLFPDGEEALAEQLDATFAAAAASAPASNVVELRG
jgi:integrase